MTASAAQRELGFDAPEVGESLDLRFARFVRENPEAIQALVEIARELKASGETRLSMKFCVEIARYKFLIRRAAGEVFAINNSYTSRFARLLEDNYEDLRGCFELRVLAAERAPKREMCS